MKKMIKSSKPGKYIPIYLTVFLTILTGLTLSTLTTALAQEDAGDNKQKTEVNEESYLPIVDFDYPLAVKLPGNINSSQEEIRPYLSAEGKALYFSRQHWTIPENLGPSVNTDKDEEFYTFRADGQYAYFTRQTSNRNSDIYQTAIPSRQQVSKRQSIPENHY